MAKVVAPCVLFKSEAIVHPDEVNRYISTEECQLSYNPQLMALLWESLATRDVRVMQHAMEHRFAIPEGCGWVNYVRCHDDIGWTFANDDVQAVGFDPDQHRRFLTDFYVGRYAGSFSRGALFQVNEETGDKRISGAFASLAGLGRALEDGDEAATERAIERILLGHALIAGWSGIPLIYMGDEVATLNDCVNYVAARAA